MGEKRVPTKQVQRQRRLAALLRRQRGAVRNTDLTRLGFDHNAVTRLVLTHRLVREYKSVYRDGTVPRSLETRVRCGLLAVGNTSMLALVSSAQRQGMLQFPPSRIQIAVPDRRRRRDRRGVDIHRFPDLASRDIITVDGVRCTAPARTVLDLAAAARTRGDRRALRRAIRQAIGADRRVLDRLRDELEQRGSFAGSRLLRQVMSENLLGTLVIRSDVEMDFVTFCAERGLPIPDTNVMIEGHEVDAAWIDEHVVAEIDTYTHHGGPLQFEADRARDEFLRERGWPVSRFTPDRWEREGDVVEAQLRKRLGLPQRRR